jgi:hypothetical protein
MKPKKIFSKIVPPNNILILSEQSERFNFSPQATHPVSNALPRAAPLSPLHTSLSTVSHLQSVTTHFLRKLSHTPPNIKQPTLHSLKFKTNFAHYDYKPSNSKNFFFKSVPLFPFSQNPNLQF